MDRNYSREEIREIRELVVTRWTESYALYANNSTSSSDTTPQSKEPVSKWTLQVEDDGSDVLAPNIDNIQHYLDEPVLPKKTLQLVGGVMMYWHSRSSECPGLSRMGSDFCSAPGKFNL